MLVGRGVYIRIRSSVGGIIGDRIDAKPVFRAGGQVLVKEFHHFSHGENRLAGNLHFGLAVAAGNSYAVGEGGVTVAFFLGHLYVISVQVGFGRYHDVGTARSGCKGHFDHLVVDTFQVRPCYQYGTFGGVRIFNGERLTQCCGAAFGGNGLSHCRHG